jgi:hypothetical protein
VSNSDIHFKTFAEEDEDFPPDLHLMSPVKEEESLTENGSSIKEGDEKSVNKKSKNYYFPTWFDITYLFDAAMIMAH